MKINAPIIIAGLMVGFMYALIGVGLVIEYRASKIVNLAHGAQAMMGAFLFNQYRGELGRAGAIVLAVTVAAGTGLVLHRLAVDFLRKSSDLNQLIVTLGVLLSLQGVAEIWLKHAGKQDSSKIVGGHVTVFGVQVGGDQLLVIGVALAVIGGLTAFFRFTPLGLAMRAAADRRHVAEYLGINTTAMGRLAWALGSALAGLAGALLAQSLFLEPIVFTILIIHAYSALLIGRMMSIPLTLVGGVLLGLAQSIAKFNIESILGVRELVALVVALGALMLSASKLEWSTAEEVA